MIVMSLTGTLEQVDTVVNYLIKNEDFQHLYQISNKELQKRNLPINRMP